MAISQSALNRAQRAAEADMRDECRIISATDVVRGEWDPVLLQYGPDVPAVTYEGKCGLNFGAVEPREKVAGDQHFVEQVGKIKLPVDGSAAVRRGDRVEIVSSETDPDMAGAVFAIGARRFRSNPSSRRFVIEETQ